MAPRHFRCDPNRLKLLLEDSLPTAQQAEVVGHLDDCAECQQALKGLAADQSWWDQLRQINGAEGCWRPAATPATDEPPCTDPGGRQQCADTLGDVLGLDFLDPSDAAAHLGRLGPFAVTAVLGRGGMGVVLKAFDAALNRPVAIKVLAPYFASSGAARKRFAREAQAAAAVVHEHVIAIHGVDSWKGLPYLVMSYVAGRSLQERIDAEGPLEVKEVVRVGMQAASGLAAAHAQGLVHRDVKPANILLENGVERVRLTDFGLARAIDDASLTQSGVIAGTPPYMAPEQAQGEAIDHRADLFSLGSTIYAMCTGHAPFRAESAMAVLRRVCDEQPRPVRAVNPDIPEWLAAVIEKLHAKEPANRFQTAAEVADLLARCLAHVQQPDANPLPVIVADPPPRRAGAPRHARWLTAAAAALLVSLGAGAAVLWTPLGRYFVPVPDAAGASDGHREWGKPAPAPVREEDTLQRQVEEARRRTAALEADLRHHAPGGFGDPAEKLLQDTRHRLDVLERELGTPAP
ncbi:MAG TPA: serine/threonine-protein kinase [Gemmataceae bacterium]|nr:serine/threonine-protein kinase [Gemmataceae bacterium]